MTRPGWWGALRGVFPPRLSRGPRRARAALALHWCPLQHCGAPGVRTRGSVQVTMEGPLLQGCCGGGAAVRRGSPYGTLGAGARAARSPPASWFFGWALSGTEFRSSARHAAAAGGSGRMACFDAHAGAARQRGRARRAGAAAVRTSAAPFRPRRHPCRHSRARPPTVRCSYPSQATEPSLSRE